MGMKGMRATLWFAAIYNVCYGLAAMAFPFAMFDLAGMVRPNYPQLWQCVGMMMAVYGVGYALAATDPLRYWPIVLVGLLGKILGPIGFLISALKGQLPWVAGWTIVTNDLVWWPPFLVILHRAYQAELKTR